MFKILKTTKRNLTFDTISMRPLDSECINNCREQNISIHFIVFFIGDAVALNKHNCELIFVHEWDQGHDQ